MSGFNDFLSKAGDFASRAAGKAKDLAGAAAEKTRDLAGTAAERTKQVSRIAKLNMDISGQKDTIKKAYAELGKLYYEAHHDSPEGLLAQVCQEIDLANAAIGSMEDEIAQLKQAMAEDDAPAEDADFEAVVDETAAEADVEVEIQVEEEPAPESAPEQENNWEGSGENNWQENNGGDWQPNDDNGWQENNNWNNDENHW